MLLTISQIIYSIARIHPTLRHKIKSIAITESSHLDVWPDQVRKNVIIRNRVTILTYHPCRSQPYWSTKIINDGGQSLFTVLNSLINSIVAWKLVHHCQLNRGYSRSMPLRIIYCFNAVSGRKHVFACNTKATSVRITSVLVKGQSRVSSSQSAYFNIYNTSRNFVINN